MLAKHTYADCIIKFCCLPVSYRTLVALSRIIMHYFRTKTLLVSHQSFSNFSMPSVCIQFYYHPVFFCVSCSRHLICAHTTRHRIFCVSCSRLLTLRWLMYWPGFERNTAVSNSVMTRGSRTTAVTKSVLPGIRSNRRQYWGLTYGHRR